LNTIYDRARYRAATGALNWLTLDTRIICWGGTPDFVASDLQTATAVGRGAVKYGYSQAMLGKAVNAQGFCQSGPVVVPAIAPPAVITWLTVVVHNATQNLSEPLLFIDEAIDLPFDANGLDLVIRPDWLASRGWWRA
jgi:hypothetical protein